MEELWPRQSGPKLIVLYDGTLEKFAEQPDLAAPSEEVHALLRALCANEELKVHLISGHSANFLRTHYGTHPRLTLFAENERRLVGRFAVSRPTAAGAAEWKQLVHPVLTYISQHSPGSWTEENPVSLVWHHRGQKAHGDFMAAFLQSQVERLRGEHGEIVRNVNVSVGSQTLQVSRSGAGRDEVMRHLYKDVAEKHGHCTAALVAGVTHADESAFADAPEDVLTVKIGATATRARFRVDSPEQMRELLWRIALQ